MNSLKDLLNIAIEQEIQSQKLYTRGLELAINDEHKQFFSRLVKEEEHHENILYNIRETELYDLNTAVNDPSLFETARTSHGDNTAAFDPDWSLEKIMEIALKREFDAQKRYKSAARSTTDAELATLLSNLAKEEETHHKVIEKQYEMLKGLMGREL